jgi:hypothetical protein
MNTYIGIIIITAFIIFILINKFEYFNSSVTYSPIYYKPIITRNGEKKMIYKHL